jgi:hypothetical protein
MIMILRWQLISRSGCGKLLYHSKIKVRLHTISKLNMTVTEKLKKNHVRGHVRQHSTILRIKNPFSIAPSFLERSIDSNWNIERRTMQDDGNIS